MYLVLLLPPGLSVDIGSLKQSAEPRQEAVYSSPCSSPLPRGYRLENLAHAHGQDSQDSFPMRRQVKGTRGSLAGRFGCPGTVAGAEPPTQLDVLGCVGKAARKVLLGACVLASLGWDEQGKGRDS